MAEKYFRGFKAISELKSRVIRLVDHLVAYHPGTQTVTLFRKDYDLVRRWPLAGAMHEFEYFEGGEIKFRGYVLSYDKKPTRYPDRPWIDPRKNQALEASGFAEPKS